MLCMFCGLCGGPNEGMHSSTVLCAVPLTCGMHMYFVLPHVMMNGGNVVVVKYRIHRSTKKTRHLIVRKQILATLKE